MIRILLLLALAFVLWRLFVGVRAKLAPPPPPQAPGEAFEPMAPCQRCGTYLPARSLSSEGLCGRCKP